MDVIADLPADPQAAEPVQLGEGALYSPGSGAESRAMFGAASRDQRLEAEREKSSASLSERWLLVRGR
ncbi:hypothetical protein GCM10010280_56790 [Streptomyces pilosus]|uniref:Uncharacterized protein n=1 Tax=Streptomyces pilosus TaxID=28893 RepID=A0A918C0Z3_9ACTN|nr:hypothetical protein GCM10010280_56790 [Streptomyces pilosus]